MVKFLVNGNHFKTYSLCKNNFTVRESGFARCCCCCCGALCVFEVSCTPFSTFVAVSCLHLFVFFSFASHRSQQSTRQQHCMRLPNFNGRNMQQLFLSQIMANICLNNNSDKRQRKYRYLLLLPIYWPIY